MLRSKATDNPCEISNTYTERSEANCNRPIMITYDLRFVPAIGKLSEMRPYRIFTDQVMLIKDM